MKVNDFITLVKDGSLHQTTVTQDSLIQFINLGLQEVYEKFNLKNKTITITLTSATSYTLPTDLTSIDSITSPGKYYRNDLGTIIDIIEDFELGINVNYDKYNSVFIDDNIDMKVPNPIVGQILTIDYRATPIAVTALTLTAELPLANQYINPLMLYVTYLGFLQNGGANAVDVRASLSLYDKVCEAILISGNYINSFGLNNKFFNRGFV
jgi:hypothetical protein